MNERGVAQKVRIGAYQIGAAAHGPSAPRLFHDGSGKANAEPSDLLLRVRDTLKYRVAIGTWAEGTFRSVSHSFLHIFGNRAPAGCSRRTPQASDGSSSEVH